MSKRITTVVGAGAVLDFEYSYENAIFPSSKNITESILGYKVQRLDGQESDVIQKVFELSKNALTDIYRRLELKNLEYDLNFEELYFLIESMLTFGSDGIESSDPHGRSPLSILLKEVEELRGYSHVEYVRALHTIVKVIIRIVEKYDNHFKANDVGEKWYRNFWRGKDSLRYDIFTFNYDTTIENSLGSYEDGFLPIEDNALDISYFDPKRIIRNSSKSSTVQHLHGCIYYSEYAPTECVKTHSNRDMFKMNSVNDAIRQIGHQIKDQTQDRELFLNSPILIGMRKLDKMTYMPSSIYHANLVNRLIRNRGVLIIGYSFGDLYVNQLLQRRLIMKGENHRMIIIEKFPEHIDSKVGVYRYISDYCVRLMAFLKPFVNFRFDDNLHLQGIKFTSYNEPIYSEDGKVILFICGFKAAVENHRDLIWRFL